ncbi:helix-turn-helix transcriptional regulator [Serratia sp. JSRIV006]|uniref:helix-turn-helix domain-containing protein n=1 Tax=Serratia sp. JSRIV006 TaxID=2831896 RepID=UPI001CBC98EB|nr:helix-turn-helix transcriptional regulator [Serratia sp. JSRIV006]UAN64755.1 helix-turn-helix domain-containing protein [Serratia sp. JSRIV006]
MSDNDLIDSQKTAPLSTTEQNWHRADILAAIRKQGTTLSELSRQAGLHERTLYNVLERHWSKGEKIVSECIGVPVEEIWPERCKSQLMKEK